MRRLITFYSESPRNARRSPVSAPPRWRPPPFRGADPRHVRGRRDPAHPHHRPGDRWRQRFPAAARQPELRRYRGDGRYQAPGRLLRPADRLRRQGLHGHRQRLYRRSRRGWARTIARRAGFRLLVDGSLRGARSGSSFIDLGPVGPGDAGPPTVTGAKRHSEFRSTSRGRRGPTCSASSGSPPGP